MNRSILHITATVAALGLAACTPTSAPTSGTAPVGTGVEPQTVANSPAPPAKPVIDSFGYGPLKLGMTRQKALEAKLIGPALNGGKPSDVCTLHEITGTGQNAWVSTAMGVASIVFTPAMTSDGVGIGSTEAKLKAEYTNLVPASYNYSYGADADGNAAAHYLFSVRDGKVTQALLDLNGQDCHN